MVVMSDALLGGRNPSASCSKTPGMQGASWQRCRVYFICDVLAVVPKGSQDLVASVIRTVGAQPDAHHINRQLAEVTTMPAWSHQKVTSMLTDAETDLLGFAAFLRRHWRQVRSTNPLSVNRLLSDTMSGEPATHATPPPPRCWSGGHERHHRACRGGEPDPRTHCRPR